MVGTPSGTTITDDTEDIKDDHSTESESPPSGNTYQLLSYVYIYFIQVPMEIQMMFGLQCKFLVI